MRVLVLGGTGFLGKKLVAKLSSLDFEVVAVGRKNTQPSFEHPKIKFVSIDAAKDNLDDYLMGTYDAAVSLVGSGQAGNKPDDYLLSIENVNQHEIANINLLNHLKDKTNRIIFASSQAVYGMPGSLNVCEDIEAKPINSYGCAKLNAENWYNLHQHKYGGKVFLFRFTGFVDGGGLIDYLIDSCLNNKLVKLHNKGNTTRDYLGSEDGINAIIKALTCECENGSYRLNIGSGSSMSTRSLYHKIRLLTGSNSQMALDEASELNLNLGFNIERAQKILGFSPQPMEFTVEKYTKSRVQDISGKIL